MCFSICCDVRRRCPVEPRLSASAFWLLIIQNPILATSSQSVASAVRVQDSIKDTVLYHCAFLLQANLLSCCKTATENFASYFVFLVVDNSVDVLCLGDACGFMGFLFVTFNWYLLYLSGYFHDCYPC